ncbi:LysR family transcriptional regulator [Deinococcus radiopugnans]|uniref:DNA-binding transcriptional LysR family regulator n=1 Tax=Deinococcus radiopugnans ATCC 19172 TaxID=585398 RepID=A0A5C4Y3J5_9DEIO|nr:LysR family transcriptional regulator [Deinococcus radiopugnans]MBB6017357.1 DNA-binding transcriptional LysR family regulator [Deinococcus radiopugnans ATCC 19172]TNM70104.1 LysR family transcriptional regulator [Deinococcus radiopugnans ATCC 19172]
MTAEAPVCPPLPALGGAHLRVLLGVAGAGSFSEAALRLGLAQSTVSHTVRAAETVLGVQIFERGRHGAWPTAAGARVLAQAQRAADALREMTALTAPAPPLCGTLRVVSCRSVIRQFIVPALNGFQRRYPDVEVVVQDTSGEHDEIEARVLSGEADLGLGRLPMRPELHTRELLADEYLIIASADAPPIRTWADFHRAAYIVCEEDCAPFIAAHVARHSRPPTPAVRLKDPQVALGRVAEGHGFTVLTGLVFVPLPPNLRASTLPTPLWRPIGSVTRRDEASPLIDAFRDAVLSPGALRAAAGRQAHLVRFVDVGTQSPAF